MGRRVNAPPPMEEGELIGERIRRLRLEKGLSQTVLAERLGLDHANIYRWEVMRHEPRLSMLPNLSRILGVTIDYLVRGRESPKLSALYQAIRMSPTKDPRLLAMVPEQKK